MTRCQFILNKNFVGSYNAKSSYYTKVFVQFLNGLPRQNPISLYISVYTRPEGEGRTSLAFHLPLHPPCLIVALVLRMSFQLRKYCISARINLVESRFNFKIEKVPAGSREEKIRDTVFAVFNRVLPQFTQRAKIASF